MFLSPIVDGHPRGMPRRRRVGIPIHRKKGFRVAEEQPLRPLPINAARNKSWKRGDSTWLERGHRPGFVNKTIREYRGGGGEREEGGALSKRLSTKEVSRVSWRRSSRTNYEL